MIKRTNDMDAIIGQNIRKLRAFRCYTMAELAEKVGIKGQQMQKYELGTNRVSATKLYTIAQIFNVPIDMFFKPILDRELLLRSIALEKKDCCIKPPF